MPVNEVAEFRRVGVAMEQPGAIFVFGSNLRGAHGAGAALVAVNEYGATAGQGEGLQGRSYALPTKDEIIRTLSLDRIAGHVQRFLAFAHAHSEYRLVVTRVGCGLAGYGDADIAPLFRGAPDNCLLPTGWRELSELSPRPPGLR